ncbi:MAG TPA: FMN-binding negative transcriptional regulator [Flavobacterium sp.]|nr:FMN-binding negative transcriptional regulator [Flavobacterium sp.]
MYDLPYHKEEDEQEIKDFINQYPFAFLTGCDVQNKPIATQVPVFIEEKNGKKILRGHIMKNTDHHRAFLKNENVLVVFTGKSTYVSGTWYSNPYIPSTWNYMSVHIKGLIRFLDDEALEEVLRLTSLHFENNDKSSTTVYDNIPDKFKQRVMNAIVAFEIEVLEIDTVFKLSQDRDAKSYQNIIEQLKLGNHDGQVIAAEMEKRFKKVFGAENNPIINENIA